MGNPVDDPLSHSVIGCAMKVHRALGPGFLESVYQRALALELSRSGHSFAEQGAANVYYEDTIVGLFNFDLLVDGKLLLELKAVSALATAHEVQLVNYLNALRIDSGLLLNFGAERLEFKRKFRRPSNHPEHPVNPV